MKHTGIIRRMDDLGRVVIPLTIRKELGLEYEDCLGVPHEICYGKPYEICYEDNGIICLVPYASEDGEIPQP